MNSLNFASMFLLHICLKKVSLKESPRALTQIMAINFLQKHLRNFIAGNSVFVTDIRIT